DLGAEDGPRGHGGPAAAEGVGAPAGDQPAGAAGSPRLLRGAALLKTPLRSRPVLSFLGVAHDRFPAGARLPLALGRAARVLLRFPGLRGLLLHSRIVTRR